MINPPQVLPEEPTAVTPHGGFCGGKSQQWLRYPTNLHVRFDERGVETGTMGELVRHRQTNGAATDMVDLKPPAPHSYSTQLCLSAFDRLLPHTNSWPLAAASVRLARL